MECGMLIKTKGEKRNKRKDRTNNQEGIRTHGEKENYKYQGILETNTIEQ